jgi:hypothetical protein
MDAETWLEYLRTSSQGLRKFLDGHHEIPASDYQRRVTNQQFADGLTRLVKLIEDLGAVYGAPEHWSRLKLDVLPDLQAILADTKDDRLGDFPKHSRFMAEHIVGVLDSLRLEQPAEGDTLPKSLPENKGGCKPKELTKNEKRALDLYNPNQPKKNRTQIYQTLGIADQKDKANKFSKLLQRVQAKHYLESEQKP